MSRHVLLNNIDHQHTRVLHRFGAEYGDNMPTVPVFPPEFTTLQKDYAILARHNTDDNSYHAIVLLGLAPDENLYLHAHCANGWDARYIPAMIEKGPFRIGFQQQPSQQDDSVEPVIHLDMTHPKVSEQQGQQLFLAQGGNSPYLQHIAATLQTIHQGMQLTAPMFAAFSALRLLQPVNIEFGLDNGEKHRLSGHYCIDAAALAALNGDALQQLHQAGFLQLAFAMLNSLSNISNLIERKNSSLRAAAKLV